MAKVSKPRRRKAPRLAVGDSRIHGKGLFALEPVRKGQWIGRYAGKPTRRNGRYVLWIDQDDGTAKGIHGTNAIRYTNHSRRPNSAFDGAELYAIRDIRPGQEITVHYGYDWRDSR